MGEILKFNTFDWVLGLVVLVVYVFIFFLIVNSFYESSQEFREMWDKMLKNPQCDSQIIKECYRYVSNGGIFGGVAEKRVGCNQSYDYYIEKSEDWTNCNPVYRVVYE